YHSDPGGALGSPYDICLPGRTGHGQEDWDGHQLARRTRVGSPVLMAVSAAGSRCTSFGARPTRTCRRADPPATPFTESIWSTRTLLHHSLADWLSVL